MDSSPNKKYIKAGFSNFISKVPRLAPNAPGSTVYCYPTSYTNPGPGSYSFYEGEMKKARRSVSSN